MAHKGRFGPVAFRRDFNLNVDNNDYGWQDGWKFFFRILPTGPAHALQGHYLYSKGAFMAARNTERWLGAPRHLGFGNWNVQLDVTLVKKGSAYTINWTLLDNLATIVWTIDYTRVAGEDTGCTLTPTPTTTFFNPLYFDVRPNALGVDAFPILWTDPPNPL